MQRREFLLSGLAVSILPGDARLPLSNFSVEKSRVILAGARVGGRAASVALDTGASASSVSTLFTSLIGMDRAGSIAVHTSAGRIQRPWGRADFELTGGVIQPRRVLIMPNELQQGVDAVLGTSELGAFDLEFSSGEIRQGDEAPLSHGLNVNRGVLPIASFESGGAAVRLLIDSGAPVSSISEEGARRLARAPDAALLFYETSEGEQLRGLKLPRVVSGGVEFTDLILRVRGGQPSLRTRSGEIDGLLGVDAMLQFDWRFFSRRKQISVNSGRAAPQAWIGMGVDFRSDRTDPGRVLGLARQGPAERVGLKIGDRLISVNGVAPTDSGRMAEIGVKAGDVVNVEYECGSRRHATTIVVGRLL